MQPTQTVVGWTIELEQLSMGQLSPHSDWHWQQLGWQIGIVSLWLSLLVFVSLILHRWLAVEPEVTRKVVHIGAGNVILIAWWLNIPGWLGIAASVIFSALTLLAYRFPLLPGIDSVGRKSLGTFFYAVSIGVLIASFWNIAPHFAAMGILIMTWGDGLAALIGQRWGQHPYQLGGMKKSWEGSLAMLTVSGMVSGSILLSVYGNSGLIWLIALLIAITATGLEAFSKLGIDNLTVPIGSAVIGFLLVQLWL
ncbi:MAG: SEC59/DGK1/VTE5 family protein [Elainella sp. Prado103]|jgi:phytol kinase|nr:SEC59/DGK1/VTE5 family protein [Elainella sp. Prado103]